MFLPIYAWSFRVCTRNLCAIVLLAVVCNSIVVAQYNVPKINRSLRKEDRIKIEKANSFLNQGNEILFANYSTGEKDSIFQKLPNYIELSKNMYVGKKIGRLLYDTNDFYKIGFESKVSVYQTYITDYINRGVGLYTTEVEGLNDSISNLIRNARSERSKSKAVASLNKGGSLIHTSNQHYQQAVLFAQEAIRYISKGKLNSSDSDSLGTVVKEEKPQEAIIAKATEVNQEEPKIEEVKELPVPINKKSIEKTPEQTSLNATEKNEPPVIKKEELIVAKSNAKDDVYYTVQIMADRKPVSESRVKLVYKGSHPIIENQGDGWYRYSFGKFLTLTEAKKALVISKTKGYVVAYKNKDRISLSEAKAWFLSNGN